MSGILSLRNIIQCSWKGSSSGYFSSEFILFIVSGGKSCLSHHHCCIRFLFFSQACHPTGRKSHQFVNYRKDICSVRLCLQHLLFQHWNNLTREYGWIFLLLHWGAADTELRAANWNAAFSCSLKGWMLFSTHFRCLLCAFCRLHKNEFS